MENRKPTDFGKWKPLTLVDSTKTKFKINDEVSLRQSDYPEKEFVLQELEYEDGRKEIRIGYYIIGKKGRAKGKWVWGQFNPHFPKDDLYRLLEKAKKKGLI